MLNMTIIRPIHFQCPRNNVVRDFNRNDEGYRPDAAQYHSTDDKKCITPVQHDAATELEQLRKKNRMLRAKNKSLFEYGIRNLNFKFNNVDTRVNEKKWVWEADRSKFLSESEELREENLIWRRRNSEMYKYGVKTILNLK